MKKTKMVFGIGIALAILAVLTSVAAAENVSYFDPQHASAETGNSDLMTIYFNMTEGTVFKGAQIELKFDPLRVDIPNGYIIKGCPDPAEGTYCWEAVDLNYAYTDNGYMWLVITGPQVAQESPVPPFNWEYVTVDNFTGPMHVKMCDCWVVANATGSSGVSPFDFAFEYLPSGCPPCQPTMFLGQDGIELDWHEENGTFTHIGEPETFEKGLVEGWNLVSLPLTPLNSSTSAVLGNDTFAYDSVYRYNAETKQFEDVTTGTLDPGIGYFVNVTTAGTWSYEGTSPYNSMNINLKQGLNMVGWLNCTKQISGNLTSIAGKYNYNARWNTGYEVYEPHAPEVFNDFDMMERGNGYWIAAKEDCTLTVSC